MNTNLKKAIDLANQYLQKAKLKIVFLGNDGEIPTNEHPVFIDLNEYFDSFQEKYKNGENAGLRQLVKNTRDYMTDNVTMELRKTSRSGIFDTARIVSKIAIISQEKLLARKIVGYQPMSGPVAQVFNLVHDKKNNNKLTVQSTVVEASTRRLKSGISTELWMDLNLQRAAPLENHVIDMVSTLVQSELDYEILTDLADLANTKHSHDSTKTITESVKFVLSEIGIKTKRKAGNYIVCTEDTLRELTTEDNGWMPEHNIEEGSWYLAGHILDNVKVYVIGQEILDMMEESKPSTFDLRNQIIVGLKNGSSETDVGYIYAPFNPLMTTGVVVDAVTLQPQMPFMTRYAKAIRKPTEYSDMDSGNYYGVITLNQKDDTK